jgi:hypothetical protein
LIQGLDGADDGDFQVHLLIRRPLHALLGLSAALDQVEETTAVDPRRLCLHDLDGFRAELFLK